MSRNVRQMKKRDKRPKGDKRDSSPNMGNCAPKTAAGMGNVNPKGR